MRSLAASGRGARPGLLALILPAACLSTLILGGCGGSGRAAVRHASTPLRPAASGCGLRPPVPPGGVGEIKVPVPPQIALGADYRVAFIRVPSGYRNDARTPLVLEFHGAGPHVSAAAYLHVSPLDRLVDREDFLDVSPQGLRYYNGNLGWNAYGPRLYPVAELPFVERLIARLGAMFCVDARRIYASGISNGANMVNYLACRPTARLIAAVAPVAGPMYGQDDGPCAPPRPVPIVDVHSVDDPLVPYGGLPSPPNQYPLPSVPAWLAGWARFDHCEKAPAVQRAAPGEILRRWTRCAGGAEILAYAVHAGHGWPARLGRRPAADVVWQFFQTHPLPPAN